MRLFHFTAPTRSHLGSILADGEIRLTDSALTQTSFLHASAVVWMTDNPDPIAHRWTSRSPLKSASFFAIELPPERVHHWPAWSRERGIDPAWAQALASSGGDPNSWYITERPIARWDCRELTIHPLPVEGYVPRSFDAEDLRRLFESAGARRALNLIPGGSDGALHLPDPSAPTFPGAQRRLARLLAASATPNCVVT